jgi:hypothetical protein
MPGRRALVVIVALAAWLDMSLRGKFLTVALNTDEGGYATIARLWREGYRLYGPVAWVDRPQALLVAYRIAGATGNAQAFRLMAILFALVTLVAVAVCATILGGNRAGAIAAVAYALLSPAPHLEGFTANGELLSEAFCATAAALAVWWLRTPRTTLLVAAALAAGVAPLVKQSAIDGVVVVAAALIISRRFDRRTLIITTASVLAAPLVAVVYAAATGFSDFWYAVVGYRSQSESILSGSVTTRMHLLTATIPPAIRDLAPLLVFAPIGIVVLVRSRSFLVVVWLAAAIIGFLAGGLYHPHYWVQLIAPLAVLAGVGVDAVYARSRLVAVTLAVVTLSVVVVTSRAVYTAPNQAQRSLLTSNDARILSAPAVGRELRRLARPHQRVFVMWANAAAYWYADRTPALRYLWFLNITGIPGARNDARAVFTSRRPPVAFAEYQSPASIDPTGTVAAVISRRYRLAARVDGVPIYRLEQ